MTLEYGFRCSLPNGVHARPASALEEVARRFGAAIKITNERTGEAADAKSVLALIGLDIRLDDPCRVRAEGEDASGAMVALRAFVEDTLPHCDDQLAAVAGPGAGGVSLPPMLRGADILVRPGTPVVQGIGQGRAVSLGGFVVPSAVPLGAAGEPEAEVVRLEDALQRLTESYDVRLELSPVGVEADILRAHRSVARDPELSRRLVQTVRARGCTAAAAIAEAEAWFTGLLTGLGSAVLRERALDVRDVCRQLLRQAYPEAVEAEGTTLSEDSVCLAELLTPAEFLALDRRYLRGLVLSRGGTTSHTVILARSFGIPTLVDLPTLEIAAFDGQEVVVDADIGALVTRLDDRARRYYQMERRRLAHRRAHLQAFVGQPGTTEDGYRIEVGANIASGREVQAAVDAGADGIGLFRTEMLFIDRTEAPTEEDQFAQYRLALAEAGGRPVIIRTLDIGGDKPIPYLHLPREDNPFLGCRGVRVYPEFETLFREQVRALVRASAFGTLKVMVPMVARAEEAVWVRAVIRDEQARLAAAGVPHDPTMAIGAMIEVPSAALSVTALSRILDFFSVGTNDLLQYLHGRRPGEPARGVAARPARARVPAPAARSRPRGARTRPVDWLVRGDGGPDPLSPAPGRPRARRDQHGGAGYPRGEGGGRGALGRGVPRAGRPSRRLLGAGRGRRTPRFARPPPAAPAHRRDPRRQRGELPEQGRGDQGCRRSALRGGPHRSAARRGGGGVATRGRLRHRRGPWFCHSPREDRRRAG